MKWVLRIFIYIFLGIGVYLGVILFSPLPYLPINLLLKNSPDMSGKITGNLYSGFEVHDLKFVQGMAGEIGVKKVVFKYNGLLDYLLKKRFVVKDLTFEGVQINLPQGVNMDWLDKVDQIRDKTFLIPPLPRDNVRLIQIDHLLIKDVKGRIGKSSVPGMGFSMLMMPLMKMGSGMPKNSEAKKKASRADFKLTQATIQNINWESLKSQKTERLELFEVKDISFVKKKFVLGSIQLKSEGMDLRVEENEERSGKNRKVHTVSGLIKKLPTSQSAKGIDFEGNLSLPHYLALSAFDKKVELRVEAGDRGIMGTKLQFLINKLNLRDYFNPIAPVSDLNYYFSQAGVIGQKKPASGSFNLGKSKFKIIPNEPRQFSPSSVKEPRPLLTAQRVDKKAFQAQIFIDKDVPGKMRVKLIDTSPGGSPNLKNLLSKVWFKKPYMRLKKFQRKKIKRIKPYFMD